nr:MAG TPA: hypothetical protein [Caudoviricetes sp.]
MLLYDRTDKRPINDINGKCYNEQGQKRQGHHQVRMSSI